MKRWFILAGVAFCAFIAYGVYNAGRNERPPPSTNAQIIFHGGHAGGQRIRFQSWAADYDRIISNADQTVLQLDNVRNGTIFKNGKAYLHVRAAHMTVNTISRDFAVNGPLHVQTVGETPTRWFDTTSAVWNDGVQRLTLARRVIIHTGNEEPLVVGSLTVDIRSGNIEMHDIAGPLHFK